MGTHVTFSLLPPLRFSWLAALPADPAAATAFVRASRFDALPLPVLLRILLVFLLASPLLIAWVGVVVPAYTLIRAALRACVGGRASPRGFPPGLGPDATRPPGLTGGASTGGHARRAAMAAALNGLDWEKHVCLFAYESDGVVAVHTHGTAVARSARHAAGRDVVLHAAAHLLCE